jgi:hypothetical protein
VKGGFEPADGYSEGLLRARNYKMRDVVFAEIKKPRNPAFHRLAHAIGTICADNIEDFKGMDPHKVIKRLQIESRLECDEIAHMVKGYGMVISMIPRSISFESMDEDEFKELMTGLCDYIAESYWPECTGAEIENMAEVMITRE